jgi:hypothetical protein
MSCKGDEMGDGHSIDQLVGAVTCANDSEAVTSPHPDRDRRHCHFQLIAAVHGLVRVTRLPASNVRDTKHRQDVDGMTVGECPRTAILIVGRSECRWVGTLVLGWTGRDGRDPGIGQRSTPLTLPRVSTKGSH